MRLGIGQFDEGCECAGTDAVRMRAPRSGLEWTRSSPDTPHCEICCGVEAAPNREQMAPHRPATAESVRQRSGNVRGGTGRSLPLGPV